MSHILCWELNTWFGQIATHSWPTLLTNGLTECNTEGCDCAAHKKDCNLEIYE